LEADLVSRTAKKPKAPATPHNAFKEREVTVKFEAKARTLLKETLLDEEMSHAELSRALTEIGVPISEAAITNKISRGGYSAAFLFQCMDVMGLELVAKPKR
jgi:hypothetical protein